MSLTDCCLNIKAKRGSLPNLSEVIPKSVALAHPRRAKEAEDEDNAVLVPRSMLVLPKGEGYP
eukprot:1519659-Amphidinium_carterae.1